MGEPQLNPVTTQTWYWKAGIVGSLGGGLVFGIIMAMMGMLPMIAGMVHSESAGIGFLVHMMISFIFGITFTVFARWVKWNAVLSGAVYGVLLWALFPFILMPIMRGMPNMAFQFTTAAIMSLMGHLIYGLVTGLMYQKLAK